MNELSAPNSQGIAILTSLAAEAQYYAKNVWNSTIQLGRVLTEAKPLVRHGEWEDWIMENAGCTPRYAQMFMQAYTRFGENQNVEQIKDRSKLFKLLALPAGTEDAFLAENAVNEMSSREVEDAVRKVRAEMNQKIAEEKKARKAAEDHAADLELQAGKVPDSVMDQLVEKSNTIEEQGREILRLKEDGNKALLMAQRLGRENESLKREIADQNDMIDETQQQYDHMRSEYLALKSAVAKGDAERAPADELTIDVFAGAVRQFIGTCARMPHMGNTFGMMMLSEKNAYDELLRTVESWAENSRRAINTVYGEAVIHE